MEEEFRARTEQTLLTVSCAFCDDWTFSGTLREGREQAKAHRRQHHPEAVPVRKSRRVRFTPHLVSRDDGYRTEATAKAAELADLHRKREGGGE